MIMIGSQVYMMFTTTRQQGESPATWLLEMKLVFQRQSLALIAPIFQNYLGRHDSGKNSQPRADPADTSMV
jgi:hypothetical protein